jgi:hypothetical protein
MSALLQSPPLNRPAGVEDAGPATLIVRPASPPVRMAVPSKSPDSLGVGRRLGCLAMGGCWNGHPGKASARQKDNPPVAKRSLNGALLRLVIVVVASERGEDAAQRGLANRQSVASLLAAGLGRRQRTNR